MGDNLFAILTAAGGASAVSCVVIASLWKFGLKASLEQFKHSQAREMEQLKADLGLIAARSSRFESAEFAAFQEIWLELAGLRVAANKLWDHASKENLDSFGEKLERARTAIYKTQVFVERALVNELRGAIHAFDNFYRGKGGLIDLREMKPYNKAAIMQRIEENGRLRLRFIEVVDALSESVYRRLRGEGEVSLRGV